MTNNKNNNDKNNKKNSDDYLINWAENEPPEHFAGDEQADDFIDDNDYNNNLDLRSMSPLGGIFMHPMHDATFDAYDNELDVNPEEINKEKQEKKR